MQDLQAGHVVERGGGHPVVAADPYGVGVGVVGVEYRVGVGAGIGDDVPCCSGSVCNGSCQGGQRQHGKSLHGAKLVKIWE